MSKNILVIDKVIKDYDGIVAVKDLNLTIEKGEIFALLGPSGCGKSTLLRMLAGFEVPSGGRIILNDIEINNIPPYSRPVNMMFQSYALFPHLTVWENIAFGLKRDKMPKDQIATRVEEMLKITNLEKFATRKPHQMSGGQQQRVALARSLAKRPQLLLLDEPLGALDKKLREQTQFELVNIIKKIGVTCVMVTHDQEEAMTMADRIGVMSNGTLLQIGKPIEIYETPNCRFVADFIGNVNLFDGIVEKDEPDHVIVSSKDCNLYVGHGITGTMGMNVCVEIRPEKIELMEKEPNKQFNWVKGKISQSAYIGSYTSHLVTLKSGKILKVTMINHDRHDEQWAVGDEVYASWSDNSSVVLTS